MLAGMYDATYGGYWGCRFYSVRRLAEARPDTGSVTVSRTGGGSSNSRTVQAVR